VRRRRGRSGSKRTIKQLLRAVFEGYFPSTATIYRMASEPGADASVICCLEQPCQSTAHWRQQSLAISSYIPHDDSIIYWSANALQKVTSSGCAIAINTQAWADLQAVALSLCCNSKARPCTGTALRQWQHYTSSALCTSFSSFSYHQEL